jgi:hypothetical protein
VERALRPFTAPPAILNQILEHDAEKCEAAFDDMLQLMRIDHAHDLDRFDSKSS